MLAWVVAKLFTTQSTLLIFLAETDIPGADVFDDIMKADIRPITA
jgi:hypothetical protein